MNVTSVASTSMKVTKGSTTQLFPLMKSSARSAIPKRRIDMPESLMVVTVETIAAVGTAGFVLTFGAWLLGMKLAIALGVVRRI